MANFELHTFASDTKLAVAAAEEWLTELEAANRAGRTLCVALSGGRIAQKLFTATVEQAKARNVSFDGVDFFWADERCVPPEDPESNFRTAKELLLAPLGIAGKKIHRLRGEDFPPAAAKSAAAELYQIAEKTVEGQPILDLIFLGMGEDGHVASLFPNAPAKIVDTDVPFLVVEDSPKPPPTRISLSYKAIFAAKNIWILISGAGKAAALRESLSANAQTPMGQVIAARPVKIFSDIDEF